MAKAMDIADYIINLCNNRFHCGKKDSNYKYPISNLYLQKIMYFLNVMYLLKNRTSLISDSKFEVWSYGPVIRDVYSDYARFGGDHIDKPVKHVTGIHFDSNGNISSDISSSNPNELSEDNKCFINKEIKKLLPYAPFELVGFSHMEPQWKNKKKYEDYSNKDTVNYYSDRYNQFWR